jgi:transposase
VTCMPEVNGSGEPCDREGHARFDGEVLETGDDSKAEWPTCRRETGGMHSLAYGATVPRQHLTLLKRAFQRLVDRRGEAEPIGRWGLAEIERLFALWHRFRAGEVDRQQLRRRLIPLQGCLGRLLRRGQANPDRKAAALCQELTKRWSALWTFARVDGVEPTNNVAERTLRPAVLWRKGSFGADSAAGNWFAERILTVAATCRQQGRPLLAFLVAANEAALLGSPPAALLPTPPSG